MKETEKEGLMTTILIGVFLLIICSISSKPLKVYEIIPEEEVIADRKYDSISKSNIKYIENISEKKSIKNSISKDKIKDTKKISEKKETRRKKDIKVVKVTVTIYNPISSQTDNSPLITADNSKIHLGKLKTGRLKWIAVSRDLINKGIVDFGSEVRIYSNIKEIDGIYEVHDIMNSRFRKRIDILKPTGHKKGKWEDIKIEISSPRA